MSSPYSALLSPDILHELFQHLRIVATSTTDEVHISFNEMRDNQQALSRAARVCKAFCEPALRSLWWAIPSSIEPALMLLGSAIEVHRKPHRNPPSMLPAPIVAKYATHPTYEIKKVQGIVSPGEWARLTSYAAYVRTSYISSRPTIPRDVLDLLGSISNGAPLFPNLRVFVWDPIALVRTDIRLLAPPMFQRLIIDGDFGADPLANGDDLWDHAPVDVPMEILRGLLVLSIKRLPALLSIGSALYRSITQLQYLHTLSLGSQCRPVTSTSFLRGISELPKLQELHLAVCFTKEPFDPAIRGFPHLRKLALACQCVIGGKALLAIFSSPHLTSLSVESSAESATSAVVSDTLNLAADTYPNLRCASFQWTRPGDRPQTNHCLPHFDTVFSSILRIVTIEEFTLSTPASLFISTGADAELARLAQSWPKLHVLNLCTTLLGPLTHAALLPFARHCPDLHTLRLRSVNFTRAAVEQADDAAPALGLQEFYVCNALVDYANDPSPGAQFLSRLFPNAIASPPTGGTCCGYERSAGGCSRTGMATLLPFVSGEDLWPGLSTGFPWDSDPLYDVMDGGPL